MPRQKEFDRDKVLIDAMLLFRDRGYEATSIQDLVGHMGINRFSLYATFRSKYDLFVESLEAYYDRVAVPYFRRLSTSGKGLAIIEAVLLELVTRVKRGVSSNGCLICNSIAELGDGADPRVARLFRKYLKLVATHFRAAIVQAKALGEVPDDVDADGHAKRLATYSTGLLMVSKVQGERDLRATVRAAVRAIR